MTRNQIAAANWKMHLTYAEAVDLLNALCQQPLNLQPHQQVVLGVPFPYLLPAVEKTKSHSQVYIAAQNCSDKLQGAFTGETAVGMIASVGATFVIIGHSERREYFNESNAVLTEKVNLTLAQQLTPIFCCGEALAIRESGTQNAFVAQQLQESLFHLSDAQIKKVVIAYEPIWAIGTGKTASAEQAQEMHAHLRTTLAQRYGAETAAAISILYGGSVKAANAKELFGMPDVDGGLVGGASLQAAEFLQIIAALK